MMKKLAVPALMLGMAAFGCSSSTTPTGGTGGTAGHATGGSAVAGHAGGGTSGGGTSGGGTSGGGTSGGGTSGGGTSGGGHPGGGTSGGGTSGGGHLRRRHLGRRSPRWRHHRRRHLRWRHLRWRHLGRRHLGRRRRRWRPGDGELHRHRLDGTSALARQVFCTNLLANCASPPAGYTTSTTCEATYGSGRAAKKHCQSYHLCWGVEGHQPDRRRRPGHALSARRRRPRSARRRSSASVADSLKGARPARDRAPCLFARATAT